MGRSNLVETERKKRRLGGMTPAQQRVAIARDALAWVRAGALRPLSGNGYVIPSNTRFAERECGKQVRDMDLGTCTVCAIGALFLAKAVRFDRVTLKEWGRYGEHTALAQHFSYEQMALIEAAFERYETMASGGRTPCSSAIAIAIVFGSRFGTDRERICAILTNIIDHDGTFVPEGDLTWPR